MNQLIAMPYKRRVTNEFSISFRNKDGKYNLLFNQKCHEFKAKQKQSKAEIPLEQALGESGYLSENLLRIELQLRKAGDIRQILGKSLDGEQLCNPKVYQKVLDYWKQ